MSEDRIPTVNIPLAEAVAIGRIAEAWASIQGPEIKGAEFGLQCGGVAVVSSTGYVRYDPPALPF